MALKDLILLTLHEKPSGLFELVSSTGTDAGLLQQELNTLCSEGLVFITKKGRYALPDTAGLLKATAAAQHNGTPIARLCDDDRILKIKKAPRLRPLPGDSILIRPLDADTCELVVIVKRALETLPAILRVEIREARQHRGKHKKRPLLPQPRQRFVTAVACDRRVTCVISVRDEEESALNHKIALLRIDRYPDGDLPMIAHIERILGDQGDMLARLRVIAENHHFSPQTQTVTALPVPDLSKRKDLRSLVTFTIDGPFSKDFDDAVSLEHTENGWLLGVHIADVSHYVTEGSPIDLDAKARGTSLYLPGYTVPMLPEALSNDLCSLMPDEDRLALSVLMKIKDGKVIDHELTRAVIHSHARLTYDQVNRLFDGDTNVVPEDLVGILNEMRSLSHEIRTRRIRQGCIELDLPEPAFLLNESYEPTEIINEDRGDAERMIEDFMLAANETVAALAKYASLPFVYRIHEDPDPERLKNLQKFLGLQNIPAHFSDKPHPGELQKVLEQAQNSPSAFSIRKMMLRSLQRARYAERPVGHYALALEDYCHFTSPIRRYPDLIVHRMLKKLLDGDTVYPSLSVMAELSSHASVREQESTLAEREADDLMKACYMKDKVGLKYYGTVSGVTGWGLYVTLENSVEGLVPIATLDDYFDYDREHEQLVGMSSRKVYRLGDRVRVRVVHADLDRGEVDFELTR